MSDEANDAGEALGPALAVLTNHDEAALAEAAELGIVLPPVEYDLPEPEMPSEAPPSDTPPSSGEGQGEGAGAPDTAAQGDGAPSPEGGQPPSQQDGSVSGEGGA